MTGKCAVVLLVKDEASDIAAWLAWYHVLGFDTCIVFDDDSTDGTWEILENAARVQDIRLARSLGQREPQHEHRQFLSYRYALENYAAEFEWLAFFDADEYLWLRRDQDIKSFLARFTHADQVCINWCHYGSSGHYLKPVNLPVEAYTWHSKQDHPVNRHVKSIVRPAKAGAQWRGMHCFDTAPDKSFLANGAPVSWQGDWGIIDTAPDWSAAKLMHYQCRSMEHFVERLHRRPQLCKHAKLWENSDLNDVEDRTPLVLAPRVKTCADAILRGTQMATEPGLIFDIGMSEGNDTAFYLAKGFRVVGVEPDVAMFYALQERFATELADGRLALHNLAAGARHGEIVEFFHHESVQGISGLSNSRAEFASGYKSYHVMTIDWPALIAKHGLPYYVKLDIEGAEAAFLSSIPPGTPLPDYVSVECYAMAPVQALFDLGYRRFKLIDQNPPGGFRLPEPQLEGKSIGWPVFTHASGPFGRDLAGEWVDFETFKTLWQTAAQEFHRTWFDCHARMA